MAPYFHVTSARNRDSIRRHGLDWRRMGTARGVAGSERPEQEGVFLALDDFEAAWFVSFPGFGDLVDVWSVEGVDADALVVSPEGHHYLPAPIPPSALTLAASDVVPGERYRSDEIFSA